MSLTNGGNVSNGQDGYGGWGPPGHQPGTTGDVPDWTAMAEAHEREARRKRLVWIGAAVAGVVAVAGIVATAVALQGSGGKPSAEPAQSAQATGSSTAPSPKPSGSATKRADGLHLGTSAQVGAVDGHNGPALTLTGASDGYAEAGPATINTAESFTVSAVVSNHAETDPKAAVSEGSDGVFAFYLGREDNPATARNQWVFKVMTTPEPGKSVMALSGSPAAAGQWTTLTGVYDAKAKTVSLYVDGVLAKSVPVPSPGVLPADSPIQIGRARWKSHWADFWNGSIADVQVWDRPLTAEQVGQAAKTGSTDIPPHGSWLKP